MKMGFISDKVVCKIAQGSEGKRQKTHYCEADGCDRTTRESKPFCRDHIDRIDYAADLLNRISNRETYLEEVEKRGSKAVDLTSSVTREIIANVWINGPRTQARLRRELALTAKVINAHALVLHREKVMIRTKLRKRKYMCVELHERFGGYQLDEIFAEIEEGSSTKET